MRNSMHFSIFQINDATAKIPEFSLRQDDVRKQVKNFGRGKLFAQ